MLTRNLRRALCALAATGLFAASLIANPASAQTPDAPAPGMGCAAVAAGTPAVGGMMDHSGHGSGSPMSMGTPGHGGMMHEAEFDLMYIDMMIPHHESIIALATVAVDELTHPRLIEIANAIVATQQSEIDELKQLRAEWYGDAEPVSMEMMMGMPGMSSDMAMMEQQMSAEWQVQTFCAAEDKDLAFIDQVIPHHQMAVDASRAAVEMATHPELVEIAQAVITAQEAEIAEIELIRSEITAVATPTAWSFPIAAPGPEQHSGPGRWQVPCAFWSARLSTGVASDQEIEHAAPDQR